MTSYALSAVYWEIKVKNHGSLHCLVGQRFGQQFLYNLDDLSGRCWPDGGK
jgi:hypothetical protein